MGSAIDEHLGQRLRRRRLLLGMTQIQLGAAIGVRFQQIQKYEWGTNKMSAARIWELAQALDVPVGYFYEGLGGKPGLARRNGHRRSA
jgi:transcriptional regulator with XRE-family HTH domain